MWYFHPRTSSPLITPSIQPGFILNSLCLTYAHFNQCVLSCFSRVWLFATPWSVTCQAPLSMGFSRQEHWNGLPGPSPGIKPKSHTTPVLAGRCHRREAPFGGDEHLRNRSAFPLLLFPALYIILSFLKERTHTHTPEPYVTVALRREKAHVGPVHVSSVKRNKNYKHWKGRDFKFIWICTKKI